jgi:cytochrome c oxidase assembly protein subunit 15
MPVRSANTLPSAARDLSSRVGGIPHALALATLAAAVPLIFFGGTVTTLHAGLAIDGWLVLEPGRGDWFLWAYPVEQWFRDVGTFVEHTHRLLGSLVGLLAIATVIAAYVRDRSRGAWKIASAALAGVIAQGVLGGLRVLEKSEDLAFLHGAFGQLVFALIGATAIATSAAWHRAPALAPDRVSRLRRASLAAMIAVYAQIVVGAWLRHGGSPLALSVHALLVLAVLACAMALARELASLATSEAARPQILAARKALIGAFTAQLALGLLAFLSVYVVVGRNPGNVGQSLFPTLHVMGGAALLLACVASFMWSLRLSRAPEPRVVHAVERAPALVEIEATR